MGPRASENETLLWLNETLLWLHVGVSAGRAGRRDDLHGAALGRRLTHLPDRRLPVGRSRPWTGQAGRTASGRIPCRLLGRRVRYRAGRLRPDGPCPAARWFAPTAITQVVPIKIAARVSRISVPFAHCRRHGKRRETHAVPVIHGRIAGTDFGGVSAARHSRCRRTRPSSRCRATRRRRMCATGDRSRWRPAIRPTPARRQSRCGSRDPQR